MNQRRTRGLGRRSRADRRWATLAAAVLVGAGGGSLLGLVAAPDRADGTDQTLAPAQPVAASTTRRPRSRFAGASSTTRHRPRTPATTARPATTTARPATTTTGASTTTATGPPTTTTTTVGDGTTTSSGGPSTTTSTT